MTEGMKITRNPSFPGNARQWPPYIGEPHSGSGIVECECVGTVYLIPASVYDLPHVEHFPTAFTEHYPVVHAAKYARPFSIYIDIV